MQPCVLVSNTMCVLVSNTENIAQVERLKKKGEPGTRKEERQIIMTTKTTIIIILVIMIYWFLNLPYNRHWQMRNISFESAGRTDAVFEKDDKIMAK